MSFAITIRNACIVRLICTCWAMSKLINKKTNKKTFLLARVSEIIASKLVCQPHSTYRCARAVSLRTFYRRGMILTRRHDSRTAAVICYSRHGEENPLSSLTVLGYSVWEDLLPVQKTLSVIVHVYTSIFQDILTSQAYYRHFSSPPASARAIQRQTNIVTITLS